MSLIGNSDGEIFFLVIYLNLRPFNTILNSTPRYEMIEEQAVLSGTVKTIAAYGAFVEMEDGVTGLVHISQLSESRVENVESAVSVGSCVRNR